MDIDDYAKKILKKAVNKIAAKFPDLLSIYVYGSFGTEYETKDSDLDLAILPTKKNRSGDNLGNRPRYCH